MDEWPWVTTYRSGVDYLMSKDGVLWADAPLPRRFHRCRVQTRGMFDLRTVDRCACGAMRYGQDRFWIEKNQRRKEKRRARRRSDNAAS